MRPDGVHMHSSSFRPTSFLFCRQQVSQTPFESRLTKFGGNGPVTLNPVGQRCEIIGFYYSCLEERGKTKLSCEGREQSSSLDTDITEATFQVKREKTFGVWLAGGGIRAKLDEVWLLYMKSNTRKRLSNS